MIANVQLCIDVQVSRVLVRAEGKERFVVQQSAICHFHALMARVQRRNRPERHVQMPQNVCPSIAIAEFVMDIQTQGPLAVLIITARVEPAREDPVLDVRTAWSVRQMTMFNLPAHSVKIVCVPPYQT